MLKKLKISKNEPKMTQNNTFSIKTMKKQLKLSENTKLYRMKI